MRKGIGLRGYGQRDPVMEYRREGFEMFDAMIEEIQEMTAVRLARFDPDAAYETVMRQRELAAKNNASQRPGYHGTIKKEGKKEPGRNDPCPCGSGKKYKNCCGK